MSTKSSFKPLSLETKYAVADAIASTYDSLLDASDGTRKAVYADVINNARFTTTSGKVHTLATYCGADDGLHITRLVIRRLTQPSVRQRTVAVLPA